jgi:Flp pilus assembly pilin Flp
LSSANQQEARAYQSVVIFTLELYMVLVRRFLKDESGRTAIEYALIAHIVSMYIIAVGQLGKAHMAPTNVAAGGNK